jgi:hypothetical protein
MKAKTLALPNPDLPATPGAGAPLVPGPCASILEPIDDSVFHVLTVIGALGALIAGELSIARLLAL